jgi:hypothetical protein
VGGAAYQVRVRAQNVYGFGQFSDPTTISASQVPAQVTQSTLSSVVVGTDAELAWTAPDPNHDPITAYKVLVRQAGGTYSEELTHCDGTSSAIVSAAKCSIPLTVLRAPPYSLALGQSVYFTVAAANSHGWSLTSQRNTAQVATIQTEPAAPTAPAYVPATSTLTSISVAWAGFAAGSDSTGGSPVTSYNL